MELDITNLEIEMNRGFLQILVLVALENKLYGYKMIQFFQQHGYTVEESTLYPILRRFEKNGWVKSEWDISAERPKKFYIISVQGRSVREKALSIWNEQHDTLKKIMKVSYHVSKS
ncbi:MAG: PadR family transcriptional regulator [Bacteroidota bacterium]